MKKIKFQELSFEYQQLLKSAEEARAQSYSPYSKIKVGAAILSQKQETIKGANMENASFPLSVCAEVAALAQANSRGIFNFQAFALISSLEKIITPCGACRQILVEFWQRTGFDFELIMSGREKKEVMIAKVSELLPWSFDINE